MVVNPTVCKKFKIIVALQAGWYCGEECQYKDWGNHRIICVRDQKSSKK